MMPSLYSSPKIKIKGWIYTDLESLEEARCRCRLTSVPRASRYSPYFSALLQRKPHLGASGDLGQTHSIAEPSKLTQPGRGCLDLPTPEDNH